MGEKTIVYLKGNMPVKTYGKNKISSPNKKHLWLKQKVNKLWK